MADERSFRQAVTDHAAAGAAILQPVLKAAGFGAPAFEQARGSGGPAAIATWCRADGMSVEAHVRGSLGIVRYSWAGAAVTHQDYLRLRGRHGEYPGYSDSPQQAFQHLAADLEGVAADVLALSADEFAGVVAAVRDLPKPALP